MPGKYRFLALLLALTAALACGCQPQRKGAAGQDFYATGRGGALITAAPPLRLAASGALRAPVPSDLNLSPRGGFAYAVFGEEKDGAVTRHVHCISSDLDRFAWRWEKETWAMSATLVYAQEVKDARVWTSQIYPVFAARDWFSALWRENGRETPEFWLAKRWSATPEDDIRLVAEYREPAPACMLERLRAFAGGGKNTPPLDGAALLIHCAEAVEDFSARADAALAFGRPAGLPAEEATPQASLLRHRPSAQPDMGRLVGRAESLSRDRSDGIRP